MHALIFTSSNTSFKSAAEVTCIPNFKSVSEKSNIITIRFLKIKHYKNDTQICLLFKIKDSVFFFKMKGMNLNVNHAVLQAFFTIKLQTLHKPKIDVAYLTFLNLPIFFPACIFNDMQLRYFS